MLHHKSHVPDERINIFISKPGTEALHKDTDATFRKGP